MPYSVVLYLDEAISVAIERAQAAVIDAGLSPDAHILDFPPHITLAISEALDVPGFEPYLREFATETPPLEICFGTLATFAPEPKVLFLALTDSSDLLTMHQRLHAGFDRYATGSWEYYRPGKLIPHCTVADGLRPEDVPRALELCSSLKLPLCSRLEEVATVEFAPTKPHYAFKLNGH